MSRTAVVLFNLGGPDSQASVQPFLFNLFNDRAIISLPAPLRFLVATLISKRRAPVARAIYAHMGGGSPILANTREQARALEAELAGGPGEFRVFIAMRYWAPRSVETAKAVKAFDPHEVILLPLYPQFSTTTTESSFNDWMNAAANAGLMAPTMMPCCHPTLSGFIESTAELTRAGVAEAREQTDAKIRILFSAHGLPKKIVERGDPYQWQVEQTAAAIAERMERPDVEWRVCYQSRVGPLEWIGPATDEEIGRAGRDGRALVVVPVAFVSEHSETLVELDIEYRKLAELAGVPAYVRVATVGISQPFIRSLAKLVRDAKTFAPGVHKPAAERGCPERFGRCPQVSVDYGGKKVAKR